MDTPLFVASEGQPQPPPGGWVLKDSTLTGKPNLEPGSFKFFDNKSDPAVEMLSIGPDGFRVRGVKVEQGPGEAEEVYRAFLAFMGMTPR